jgi:deoxyribodipyrimidine photolyase
MKRIFLSFLLIGVAVLAFGQKADMNQQASVAADELTSYYQLDQEQQAKMLTIQQRHFKHLAEIQSLEKQDLQLYIKKMKAIQKGTDIAVQLILREDQMNLFYSRAVDRRQRQADLARNMQSEGASPREIEMALIKME